MDFMAPMSEREEAAAAGVKHLPVLLGRLIQAGMEAILAVALPKLVLEHLAVPRVLIPITTDGVQFMVAVEEDVVAQKVPSASMVVPRYMGAAEAAEAVDEVARPVGMVVGLRDMPPRVVVLVATPM